MRAANWAALSLPKILRVNLGRNADKVCAFSVGYPFVETGMTQEYADNPKVFGRWQPRMLQPFEAAQALYQLLTRPKEELSERFFQLLVDPAPDAGEGAIALRWNDVVISSQANNLSWSDEAPLTFST